MTAPPLWRAMRDEWIVGDVVEVAAPLPHHAAPPVGARGVVVVAGDDHAAPVSVAFRRPRQGARVFYVRPGLLRWAGYDPEAVP